MFISIVPGATGLPVRRSDVIDSLRAIALFGVILVNMAGITMVVAAKQMMASLGSVDIGVMLVEVFFVFGKARAAFAFLFGVGFGILLLRAESRGGDFNKLFSRRMLALLGFGIVNQLFFFFGDILLNYALLGFALMLFRRASDRILLSTGFALIFIPAILAGLAEIAIGGPLPNLTSKSIADASAAVSAQGLQAYSSSNYLDAVAFNASWVGNAISNNPVHRIVYNLSVFGLFLLGFLVARHGILLEPENYRPLLRKVARICLPVGFTISAIFATGPLGMPQEGFLRGLITASFSGPPVLALGYIAALTLLFTRRAKRIQGLLAPAGRMALTNYLASGAIGSFCFYGYGLGWLGSINIAGITLFALVLFLGLLIFSHIWLAKFRVGPAEWLWRSLTYANVQPILRAHTREPAVFHS